MPCLKYSYPLVIAFYLSTATAAEHEVIIGFNERTGPPERKLIHDLGGTIQHEYKLIPAIVATLPEPALPALNNHPLVAYIEGNSVVTTIEPPVESEASYTPELFAANTSSEYERSWGVQHIGSKTAHQQGITGKGVKIAVIDTGIDYQHEDLNDNYQGGYNFIDGNDTPMDDSYNSHGTNVAGIIAAEKNGSGVVGVAPEASLYSLKVLNSQGNGLTTSVIAALQWSVEHNMDIASISIQGMHTKALQAACNAAYEAGLLIIAAAGNSYGKAVSYPAAYSSVIAVTGTDANDQFGYFSPIDTKIELSAPGVIIPSTARNGTYGMLSGTSQAAPHVAGTAALLMSRIPQYPTISGLKRNEDIRMKLQMSILDLGLAGKDELYGYGLINAALPKVNIDNVTCNDSAVTVRGTGFGRYLDNGTSTTVIDTNTAAKCTIETWTTSQIIADCGRNASGSVKVTSIFGNAYGTCYGSNQSPGRPNWWAMESWWSYWSWFRR